VTLFRTFSQERAGEVLPELDDHALLELVRALDEVEVSRILDEMPPEHAADVVEELPPEEAEKILDLMQEEKSEEVQEILEYPEHPAARLMSPPSVPVSGPPPAERPSDTTRKWFSGGRAFGLYGGAAPGLLAGGVPLPPLPPPPPPTPISAVRDENVVSAPA